MDTIAVSGKKGKSGIPAASVAFGSPGNQATATANVHTLTIFTKIDKSPEADIVMNRDNDNEVRSIDRSNKTMRLTFSAKPVGATTAAAQTIAEACPLKYDVVVITCTDDDQIAVTAAYVDSASVGYTPDGEAVMDLTVIKYPSTFAVAT